MHSQAGIKYALIAGLLILSPLSAQATIYQWVDDGGITHFSETPPMHSKWQIVAPSHTQPNNPEAAQRRLQQMLEQQKLSDDARTTRKQETQKKAVATRQAKQNCAEAKKRLDTLQARPRLLLQHSDGTATRLTEEQRQERIQKNKEKIQEFCR